MKSACPSHQAAPKGLSQYRADSTAVHTANDQSLELGTCWSPLQGGGGGWCPVNLAVVNLDVGHLAEARNKEGDMEHAKHTGVICYHKRPYLCTGVPNQAKNVIFGMFRPEGR